MEASSKFGVSCWHKSEYESEAMWRLYSAECIAIESTIGQLQSSFRDERSIIIENVRYMDFENDSIEKGYKHYGLFLKRKSFEYEKEVRAIVLLNNDCRGTLVKCDLDTLINCVHLSPSVRPYFKEVVGNILAGKVRSLNKPVRLSVLYEKPDYTLDLKS
jgi:hypothetical protein